MGEQLLCTPGIPIGHDQLGAFLQQRLGGNRPSRTTGAQEKDAKFVGTASEGFTQGPAPAQAIRIMADQYTPFVDHCIDGPELLGRFGAAVA
jgi:hypothetical protein